MLTTIDDKGGVYPHGRFDNTQWDVGALRRLEKSDRHALYQFLNSRIQELDKFSVATHFNKWANTPMEKLYEAINDEKEAGRVLGVIVLNLVVETDQKWMCSKTNLANREFSTNFYWRK